MREKKVQKIQKALSWAIILSETTHVFCCVLPVIVSTVSLLSVIGVISAAPVGMMEFHEFMHAYEIPMITASGVILALGWVLYAISCRLDCRSSGCGHEPCAPKKTKASRVLKIATALFAFNLFIYVTVHIPFDGMSMAQGQHAEHVHEHDGHAH